MRLLEKKDLKQTPQSLFLNILPENRPGLKSQEHNNVTPIYIWYKQQMKEVTNVDNAGRKRTIISDPLCGNMIVFAHSEFGEFFFIN